METFPHCFGLRSLLVATRSGRYCAPACPSPGGRTMYRPLSGSAPRVNSWLDVQSAIRELTQDFATAFNTGNYDQAAAFFTSDGFLMPPQREAVQGQKPIELTLRRLGDAGYQNLRLETIRVEES